MKLTRRKFIETTAGAAAMAVPVVAVATTPKLMLESQSSDAITLRVLRKMARQLEASGVNGPFAAIVPPSQMRSISQLFEYVPVENLLRSFQGDKVINPADLPKAVRGIVDDVYIIPTPHTGSGLYVGSFDSWLPMIERIA